MRERERLRGETDQGWSCEQPRIACRRDRRDRTLAEERGLLDLQR